MPDKTVNEIMCNECKNFYLLKHIVVDGSQSSVPVDQPKTYHVSNDNSNAILNSQSANDLSLKEKSVQNKNVPKQNLNDDLRMRMNIETTQLEVIYSIAGAFLELGQQTINNGEIIHGSYDLIEIKKII